MHEIYSNSNPKDIILKISKVRLYKPNSKDHERHFHCKYQYKGKYEEKKGTDNRRESRETSKKLAAFVFWVDTAHKDTQRSKTYHHLQPVCYIIRKISFYSCTCRESDERNNAMSSAVLGKDDIR